MKAIKDYLQPKSEDDIEDALKDISIFKRIRMISSDKLPKEYFPTKQEIEDALKDVSVSDRIKYIYYSRLPEEYFPTKQNVIDEMDEMSFFDSIQLIMLNSLEHLFTNDEIDDIIKKTIEEKIKGNKDKRSYQESGDFIKFCIIDTWNDSKKRWVIYNKSNKQYKIYKKTNISGAWDAVKTFMT